MLVTIMTILIWGLTGFLVVGSLLPLSKVPFGAIRAFAFPRMQMFWLAIGLGILALWVVTGTAQWIVIGLLVAVALCQAVYIVKFTPLWSRQSVDATKAQAEDSDNCLTMITANVKLSNRAYDRLIALIRDEQPDVVMAIEVDEDWISALRVLGDIYEHWISVPKDNGYGLCLMSRLPLDDAQVRELVTDEVPSVKTTVTLRSGQQARLYAVHPEPPIATHDTIGRDSEIALAGLETKDDPLPCIVSGDLNDVAWSTTTRRFQRLSGLLDPRVGRGFFNTFNAFYPFARWPLDHLFHDPRFRLIDMRRLPKIGSDHFPMLFSLALAADPKSKSDPGSADADEKEEVKSMIRKEASRDREAIGSDWEDE